MDEAVEANPLADIYKGLRAGRATRPVWRKGPSHAHASGRPYRAAGTFAFSSSNQFVISLMWVTGGGGGSAMLRTE